ncbi:MAG: 50S ribosomal protein L31 [Caldilineaceae bacterium]|nr:50S ribosomal protein L31 [Caldilineaceae bacterium]
MRAEIHPTYYENAQVTCACGNSWLTGSTVPAIQVSICSQCHPFYTGEQRIVDTVGRVERFVKRLEARQSVSARQEIEAKVRRESEEAARKARARGDDPEKAAADVVAKYATEDAA